MKKIRITEEQLTNLKKNSTALNEEVKRFRSIVEQDNSNPWKSSDFNDNSNDIQGTGFENQNNNQQQQEPIRDNELGVVDALKYVLQNYDQNSGDQHQVLSNQMGLVGKMLFSDKVRFSIPELDNMIKDPNEIQPPQEQQQPPEDEHDQYPEGNQGAIA